MSFISPQWWWALTALSIPLVIHLLSRGRRQRIAIGSVRHLAGAESRALRQLRLSDWPLLLLRLLLLTVLVFALAGPRSPHTSRSSAAGGWVLIEPDLTSAALGTAAEATAILERLATASSEAESVRVLAPGLPESPLEMGYGGEVDVWSLLREADAMAPRGIPFSVFSFDRVALLRGRRPHLERPVDWVVIADPEPNRWIERVVRDADANLVSTIGESSRAGTRVRRVTWKGAGTPPPDTGLAVTGEPASLHLIATDRYPGDDVVPLPGPPTPLRVALLAGADRQDDAWYLRQAVEAVSRFSGRELNWVDRAGESADLEIRLGQVSNGSTSAALVLQDSESSYESCQAWVLPEGGVDEPAVRLRRCTTQEASQMGVGRWVDGWGRPFLSQLPGTAAAIYQLQSRFDPRWSDLVTTTALPRMLLSILDEASPQTRSAATPRSDRRATTGTERLPVRAASSSGSSPESSDLPELLAWLVTAVLIVSERVLSGRTS